MLTCIVPPHILREIVRNGTRLQRDWALYTLSLSEQMRGQRAISGELLSAITPAGEKRRTIYDARGHNALPGKIARAEGDPPVDDVAVNEAYDGAGATYDFYKKVYGRNSVDDRGLRLDSTVHYGKKYDNAFWNGRQMVYGDGDGQLFNRFTISLDVIGHELTHGVTQYEAGLLYEGQPGALNESMSDVFGSLVKQKRKRQTAAKADWLIGAGLLADGVKGVALRSMAEPGTAYDDPALGKDPQPGHMKDYKTVDWDSGGVHINSGIPNHAFYLAARELGGHAWEKAGRIWYEALCNRFHPNTDFRRAATLTSAVAAELFGKNSIEQKAVRSAWKQVGL
ncbi:MAG: M4 family metallopeptidase [Verrucomicrobiota bacterium]|nr:M4 family metallopeptidase [Verrucomicrobiota bacterium]